VTRSNLWLLMSLALLSSCALVFPGHPDSNARAGEEVSLKFAGGSGRRIFSRADNDQGRMDVASAGAAAAAVGFLVDFVGRELDKEAQKYEASFGATTCLVACGGSWGSDKEIYAVALGVPGEVLFHDCGTLTLERRVAGDSAATFSFCLKGDPNVVGAFQVVLRKVHLQRVRAKVFDGSWRRGWLTRVLLYGFLADLGAILHNGYGDDAIDLNVSLVVEADVVTQGRLLEKRRIASLEWVLQDVPFGAGSCPRDVDQDGGWITLPATAAGLPLSITVTVEEADEFGPLVAKASQILKKNREKIVDLTKPK
jgi:hypothetical protein